MTDRASKVEKTLKQVRANLASGVTRETLAQAKDSLVALAGDKPLWNETDFPPPEGEERQARYLIAQDDPNGLTLYLNVMRPGKKIPPHNHTVWACVAAVEGVELNTLYDRHDDSSVEGKADVREREVVSVEPGRGVALMADDIHSVEIPGDQPIRHLHMYGKPLETLTDRLVFDLAAGTCKIMPIGVQTRR